MLWHGANICLDLSKSKTIDNLPETTSRLKLILVLIQKRIYSDACGDKSYIKTREHLQMHRNYRKIGVFSQRLDQISNISKATKQEC